MNPPPPLPSTVPRPLSATLMLLVTDPLPLLTSSRDCHCDAMPCFQASSDRIPPTGCLEMPYLRIMLPPLNPV